MADCTNHPEPQTKAHAQLAHGRRMLRRAKAMCSRVGQRAALDHIADAERQLTAMGLEIPPDASRQPAAAVTCRWAAECATSGRCGHGTPHTATSDCADADVCYDIQPSRRAWCVQQQDGHNAQSKHSPGATAEGDMLDSVVGCSGLEVGK